MFAARSLNMSNDPRAARALLEALRAHKSEIILMTYTRLIGIGEPGSEDALIEALNTSSSKEMGEAYLNCGNAKLEAAARAWAGMHSYQVNPASSGGATKWGSAR
jgi:hypothetical protein